jgi:hypothetical protein
MAPRGVVNADTNNFLKRFPITPNIHGYASRIAHQQTLERKAAPLSASMMPDLRSLEPIRTPTLDGWTRRGRRPARRRPTDGVSSPNVIFMSM